MSLSGLDGKVFIVTGAGSGIGYATAQRLVEEGARVVASDVNADAVAGLVDALGSDVSVAVVADSGVTSDITGLFDVALSRFGVIDGIFNNAGITAPRIPIIDTEVADFERLVRVNMIGTFVGIQTMLRSARQTGRAGVVVNTSSGIALRGAPNHGIYAATKTAIISLTKTAAIEGAVFGVRVNAVLPGPTETPTLLSAPAERMAEYLKAIPTGRLGTPREVASGAAWLFSSESSFVTGMAMQVDGGQSA